MWVANPSRAPEDLAWGADWSEASPGGANWYDELIRALSAWELTTGRALGVSSEIMILDLETGCELLDPDWQWT